MFLESSDIFVSFSDFAITLLAFVLMFAGLILLSYFLFLWWKYRGREKQSLEFVLLQVTVPKDNEVKIDAAEQFFSALASLSHGGFLSFLKNQDHLSFEIVARPGDIRFYVSVHHHLRDLVEKQIYGMYPGAEIKEVDEYNLFDEKGKVAFASLILKSAQYLPMKPFKDLPVDPMSAITSNLGKMQTGEGASIQILVTPAAGKWKSSGKSYLSGVKKNEANPEKAHYNVDHKILETIENKLAKPGFLTTIRVVVSSTTLESAKMHLHNIESVFAQFSSDQNHLGGANLMFKSSFVVDFLYRYFPILNWPYKQYSVLTSEELATLFHFPNKSVENPHINWVTSKSARAPAEVPTSGLYLGKSAYRGISRPIHMDLDARRRHIYIIGKTGD